MYVSLHWKSFSVEKKLEIVKTGQEATRKSHYNNIEIDV